MKLLEIVLLVIVAPTCFYLWWKLFQLGNKRKRETLEVLNKRLEASVRENGVKGSILHQKSLVLIFWAVVIIVLVFGLGGFINRLFGN